MSDYNQMWSELGLDLEAHDVLLSVLGDAYQNIFMTQKNRPEGMKYFDFVMGEVHGLRIKELIDAKVQGRKVIGSYCVFVPEELILAVDSISVGLCAGAEFNFEGAEQVLPRNICALIKSAFGFKLGRVCPYIEACDLVVGENTCDGKKKAYEVLSSYIKDLYIIDLPQTKSNTGKMLLKGEYLKFIAKLEEISGKKITYENFKKAIDIVNAKRKAVLRLAELRKATPVPISGLDSLLINQIFFYDDPVRFTNSVNALCDELEERIKKGEGVFPEGTVRVIISGCPMAVPNWKVPYIVETSGAAIVGEESCVGERGTRWLTETKNSTTVEDLLENITDRYFKIDCAIFTPNPSRLDHIKEMFEKYYAKGIIHYNLQFCQPYIIESGPVEADLENNNIPTLRLETDYSQEDINQLKTRIEAFIERIKG